MSNLLQKASIITTPTAYSEGELHSVKPVQTFGSEVIADPNFDTDSTGDWSIASTSGTPRATKSYISNEKFMRLNFDLDSGAALFKASVFVVGFKYRVKFIAKGTANSDFASIGNNNDLGKVISNPTLATDWQNYEFEVEPTGTLMRVYLTSASIGGTLDIDEFSVKEVIDADFDFTRDSSATRVNEQGLIEEVGNNIPRIDYTDGTGSLLLEPQSTNLVAYSNLNFGTSSVPYGWIVGFGTGAYSHTPTTYKGQPAVIHRQETTGRSYLRVLFTGTNAEHTIRVEFDKSRCLNMEDSDPIISTIGVTNSEAKFWSDVDANGVLEFQTTFGADASGELRIGFGVVGNEGVNKTLVWGMPQIELGSYATSYIPTSGSTVTRSADVCNNAGSSDLINSTEGVLYAEVKALHSSNIFDFGLYGNTSTNQLRIGFFNNDVYASLYNGSYQAQMSAPSDLSDFTKIAFKFKENDFALWINGNEVANDTIGATFNSGDLVKLNLSAQNGTSSSVLGKVKSVAVFKEALTDSELECLTRI